MAFKALEVYCKVKQMFKFHLWFSPPNVSQRRYKLNRTVLSKNPFSLLGNRDAVSMDYMPLLRFLCRLQRTQQQDNESDG